jgi:hypothetical protein
MDLENELRQAMADHVTEVSASRTLASEAKRRHHRTVRRRTAFAVGAAGVVVAVAMIPTYQSIRPQTVGADGPEGGKHGQPAPGALPVSPTPTADARSNSPGAGSNGSRSPAEPRRSAGSDEPGLGTVKSLLGYLPKGLMSKPCTTDHTGSRETRTCRWTGSGGWVEVRLVRDSRLKGPADLGLAPPMAEKFRVHDHPALRTDGPALPSQVMWIERHGLGVWVGVSPSLGSSLTRVANGVNVT